MRTIESFANDYKNVREVQNKLEVFGQLLWELKGAYEAWRDVLSEEELVPAAEWYEHWRVMIDCKVKTTDWVAVVKQSRGTPGRS